MRFYRNLNYEQLVELWRKEELKRRASRPTVLFHNGFTPAVTSYGFIEDAGAAPAATSPISFVGSTSAEADNGGNVTLDLTNITGLAEGDIVIVANAEGNGVGGGDFDMSMVTSGYTEVADLFADDTGACNFGVFWKIMGATPDTTAVTTGHGNGLSGNSAVCMAFRGVHQSTPMDVTPTTATGTNSVLADCPSIDYAHPSCWVVACGGGGQYAGGTPTFGAPANYDDIVSISGTDSRNGVAGMCYRPDPADPEDPGAFSFSASNSAGYSWCACTIALRPAFEDTTYDVDVSSGDVQLYLFVQIEEQGDDSSNNNAGFQLRFDPAGGTTWQNVTAATSGIYGTADANTAATDEQTWATGDFKLTGEEGTAYAGLEMTDDMTETAAAFDFQAANYTELVFALTADAANLSDSQSITFNVAIGGTDITLDVTPTLTVTKGGAAPTGTLSGEIQALSMTAVGEQQFLGTGDFQGQPAELDATAHMVPEAAADLAMQDAVLDADGVQVFVGTGDLEIQIAELAAVGQEIFIAAGDFVFGLDELVAAGLMQPAGVGDIEIQVADLDAAGAQIFVGTASFESQIAELATSGEGAEQPAGAGDFEAQLLALDAEGVIQPAGVGNLEVQDTELDAEGSATEIAGTAAFERLTNP